MKNKKIWLSIVGILILGIIFLLFINFYTFNKVGEKLAIKKGAIKYPEKYEIYKTIKCDSFNFWNPEYAFVNKWKSRDNYEIMFYKVKPKTYFSQDYNFKYIGGTDIENTNFQTLLKMVKNNCYQFQKDSKDIKDFKYKDISWGYREYDKEAEDQEKIHEEKLKEYYGIKTYPLTEENLEKVKMIIIERGGTEKDIEEYIQEFKKEGEIEVDADLEKIKLDN